VNKKNNTRRQLSVENLRKTLMLREAGLQKKLELFLICTENGAIAIQV
jgi:hypothetical protein